MTNEEVLQRTLIATISRLSKQAQSYEEEIANLNAQIIMLGDKVQELTEKNTKVATKKNDS